MLVDATVIKTFKVLSTTIVFGLLLLLAYKLRSVISWLAIGLFLAVIINPAVSKLTKYMPGKKRGLGVAVVILLGIVLVAGLMAVFLPPLIRQSTSLVQNWPQITDNLVRDIESSDEAPYKFIRDHGLLEYFQEHKEGIKEAASAFFGTSLKKAASLLGSIGGMVTILAVAVYMSVNGPKYAVVLKRYLPKHHHKDIEQLTSKMYSTVTGYVNGNLLTSGIAGIACGIVATLLGLPYPALLALIVAFTDLIPMIGATLGAVVVIVIALFSTVGDALIMTIFFLIYQQLENYVIVPRVMSKTVEMSSFAVFLAALAGGVLAGFVGALVAIPIGACLQILAHYSLKKWFPHMLK